MRVFKCYKNTKANQTTKPVIGAVILCMKFGYELNLTSTESILNSIKMGINAILDDKIPIYGYDV